MSSSQIHDSHTIAESTTSSTQPILRNKPSTDYRTSATMSDVNGKAPINGARVEEPIIKVQPPRREDLQPSYAKNIQADDADADTNGWYGSMVCVVFRMHISPR